RITTLPWDASLQSQHDIIPMQCLPYTLTPFTIASKLSGPQPQVVAFDVGGNVNVQLKQSSIKFRAAYPVLIPLYLARYHDADGKPFTMITEAYNEKLYGTRAMEGAFESALHRAGVPPSKVKTLRDVAHHVSTMVDRIGVIANGAVYQKAGTMEPSLQNIDIIGLSPPPGTAIPMGVPRAYEKWLEQSEATWMASRAAAVDMEDLRPECAHPTLGIN
ncbi:hypothetical protein OF83DRAFT_1093236, partial [Amylostereum chailletii]